MKACFRDGLQSEYLALQRRELEDERFQDFVVLDEFRAQSLACKAERINVRVRHGIWR
jgi:hypothetical protein